MAWTVGRLNPLILYPTPNVYNAGMESAFGGSNYQNWQAGGSASRITTAGEMHSGDACARLNPTAATAYLDQYYGLADRAHKSVTAEASCGAFYVYFWAKAKAHTGNAYMRLEFRWLNSAYATISSSSDSWPIGSSAVGGSTGPAIPIDNTWRFYRNVTAFPSIPSNAVYLEIVLGDYTAAGTYDLYLDDVMCGHVLDGQDMVDITNYGAMAAHPFRYGSTAAGTYSRAVSGKYASRRYHTGYRSGELQYTVMSEKTRLNQWAVFVNYVADGTPFTLNYNQSEMTRDYISKAILSMDDDGLTQVPGTPHWRGAVGWREVP